MSDAACSCDPATMEAYCHVVHGQLVDAQVIGIVLACVLGAALCFWKARN